RARVRRGACSCPSARSHPTFHGGDGRIVLEQPYEFVQAQRTRLHEDLGILTGGLPVSTEPSVSLHAIQLSQLGEADRVVIDGQTTTIIAGAGNEDAVAARIEQLRSGWPPATASTSSSSTSLRQRMARLGGRVA